MACEIVVTPTAAKEVADIFAYLVPLSGQAARTFEGDYRTVLENIAGGVVEYRPSRIEALAAKGYRTAFFNRYVLLYKKKDEVAYVAHVFHQSQDYARLV